MADAQAQHGTGTIESLTIHSNFDVFPRKDIDIRKLSPTIRYYESILNNSVSTIVSIQDGINLKEDIPITGGEELDLIFTDTYDSSDYISSRQRNNPFRVYKLANRKKLRANLDSYEMMCSKNHSLQSNYMTVDRAYRDRADNIIRDILKDYLKDETVWEENVNLDPTVGLHNVLFNRLTPFQSIYKMIGEIESASDGSSCYFFWETNDGYNLRNLDNMLNQPLKIDPETEKPVKPYVYVEGDVAGDEKIDPQRILSFKEGVSFDLLSGIVGGEFGVETKYFDPIRKTMGSSTYLHDRDWESTLHSNPYPSVTPNVGEEFGSKPSLEKYMVTNYLAAQADYVKTRDDDIRTFFRRKQNVSSRRNTILKRIESNKVEIVVYGDSRIKAGQTIEILVPKSGQDNQGNTNDAFTSGKYLVVGVKHQIDSSEYHTSMTIVKDSNIIQSDDEGEDWR